MDIEASYNFRRITASLTTSGIVRVDGLKALQAQGYEVVVNLLPDTSENAIPDEREIVESQGIEYIHIPVDFKQPSDFLKFSEALDRVHHKKIHVHCAANYRVSAFYSHCVVLRLRLYTWIVPYVIDAQDRLILKTAYPSRKYHRIYGDDV